MLITLSDDFDVYRKCSLLYLMFMFLFDVLGAMCIIETDSVMYQSSLMYQWYLTNRNPYLLNRIQAPAETTESKFGDKLFSLIFASIENHYFVNKGDK